MESRRSRPPGEVESAAGPNWNSSALCQVVIAVFHAVCAASRARPARSLRSATIRRSMASICCRSRRSSALSPRPEVGLATGAARSPGDRLEGQVIAPRTLADDRLERDVVEEVDLPEGFALRRIGQVDLDERPLDREQGVAQRHARVSQTAGVDDGDVEIALVQAIDQRASRRG